ncbi:probable serine/threonine-protein kinase mps1 [Drosophila gunungcola]|nr:probable serine/threonine-protein kinase mps1 [Drosophila gunungcola]
MCLLVARASTESMIEVDENGDEYELKRFYIQGRQLSGDGSQSQCVVTRRKRSGRALQAGASVSVSSQPLKVESLPLKEHREGGAVLQEVENSNKRYVALTGVHLESLLPNDDDDQDDIDDEEEEVDDEVQNLAAQSSKSQSNFVPAALALPLQSQTSAAHLNQAVSAAHLNQGVSVVANAASHANVAEDAGIVVVQSHQPPKVNPDTHAVFELKPIQSDADHSAGVSFYPFVQPWEVVDHHPEDDYDGDDDYDEEEDFDGFYYGNGYYRDHPADFHGLGAYEEEIISEDQPVTTIASWATGEEDDGDIRPVVNKRPNQKNKNKKNQKNKNKNKNQNQKNQQKRRQQQKKRKQEAQDVEELSTKKKKQPQQQDKDQKKKKQDKDQKKKKPEENQQEMEQLTPVDVIKKPVAMDSTATVAIASSSGSNSVSLSSSASSNSTDQKKKKKKKKPSNSSSNSSSVSQRKTKKKKKQSSSSISSTNKRRRRPSSNSSGSSSSSSIGGYRRRPQQQQQSQRRRETQQQQQKRRRQQQQQKRRRQQQQKRRRIRNKNRQFYGDEPIINCIYINKDPVTTTTPRPFWNILGRQSEVNPSSESSVESQVDPVAQQAVLQAVRRNFGEFGGRKRTNLRFVS